LTSLERQQFLMETATREKFVSIPKTAEILGVSVETIRRDVNILCKKTSSRRCTAVLRRSSHPFGETATIIRDCVEINKAKSPLPWKLPR